MTETVETLIVTTKGGPVRINASDFDPATMKLAPVTAAPDPEPVVAAAEPEPAPVQMFVAKKGKGFIVTDAAGVAIDSTIYESEDAAWQSTLPKV